MPSELHPFVILLDVIKLVAMIAAALGIWSIFFTVRAGINQQIAALQAVYEELKKSN